MKTRFKSRMWRHPGNQALVLLVLALLLLLAAVPLAAASESASPAASEGTTFRVGWLLEPDNLNPFIGLLGQDYEIWHLNYDFLVGFDAKDLSPKPELAESWEVSEDGKTWTFKIRQGVKWQDGEPLTAKDVAFTYNYIVDNDLQTLAIYTGGITGANAVDDTTVEITTELPKSNMLAMVVPIIPEHIWSKVSGEEATTSYQNKPPIIGSGPFQVVEWNKGKYIRLEANKDYWGGAPKIDTLLFENYKSADTMTADLKQGTIDAAVELPQAQYPSVESTEGVTGLKGTHWRFNELGFNCYDSPDSMGNPVLLDEKFRSALNWAIDRQKIVDVAFFGQADVGLHAHRAVLAVPLGAGRGPGVHLRPRRDQDAARPGRLRGHGRRRLPRDQGRQAAQPAAATSPTTRPRTRRRPSSSPAGSRTSGSRSPSRSSTPACCSTPSTTTRATRTRRTTTCSSGSGPTTSTPR